MSTNNKNIAIRTFKIILLWGFCFLTLFCVGYAHSETLNFRSSSLWFGLCALRVEKQNGVVTFKPSVVSSAEFSGFWPDDSGEVTFSSTKLIDKGFRGIGETQIEETLTVSFKRIGRDIVPSSYEYSRDRNLTPFVKSPTHIRCEFS